MLRTRPTLSLLHELPQAQAEAWTAIAPAFSLVGGPASYAPEELATRQALREASAREGGQGLRDLARPTVQRALRPWQLALAEAGARIKLGETEGALACLARASRDPTMAASLAAPALSGQMALLHAHWLWLLAHVAIENGQGAAVLPALFPLGLEARAALEPQLASGLVVNALRQGDEATLTLLCAQNVRLSHSAQQLLRRHTQLAVDAYFGPNKKYVRRDPHKCSVLAWLRRAHDLLNLPTDLFAAYDAHVAKQAAPEAGWRKLVPRARSDAPAAMPSALPTRRTTGVQLRSDVAADPAPRATRPAALQLEEAVGWPQG